MKSVLRHYPGRLVFGPKLARILVHEVNENALGEDEKKPGDPENDVKQCIHPGTKGRYVGRKPPAKDRCYDEGRSRCDHDCAEKKTPPALHEETPLKLAGFSSRIFA